MMLIRQEIARLVPHDGTMCLLDTVQSWDDIHLICTATSHRNPSHPLRDGDVLRAVCGIEYAAQAIAAHRGLLADKRCRQSIGVVGGIRDFVMEVERLEDITDDLSIRVDKLIEQGGSLMYRFSISAGGRLLLSGRASVMTLNGMARGSHSEPNPSSCTA
jgi:predicted hotdog family 3-hydroxylacyl-ACP dehydratase